MPFAIREQGERNKLAEHVKTIQENGTDGKPSKDQSLIESVKASILTALASLPTDFNGALVIAEGSATENTRSGTFQVIGQKGHY